MYNDRVEQMILMISDKCGYSAGWVREHIAPFLVAIATPPLTEQQRLLEELMGNMPTYADFVLSEWREPSEPKRTNLRPPIFSDQVHGMTPPQRMAVAERIKR